MNATMLGDNERQQFMRLMQGPTGHEERLVPEVADPGNLAQHLKRYDFAAAYCNGKIVLDAGSGIGYGADILARAAEKVYGIDYDTKAIHYASNRYNSRRLQFLASDVALLPFKASSMDVAVSFEVIEHVPDHSRFLKEICRVLKPEGTFLVSTPNNETASLFREKTGGTNEAHVSEVSLVAFRKELQQCFAHVRLFGMRLKGTALYTLVRALDPWNLRLRVLSRRQIEHSRERLFRVPSQRLSLDDVVVSRWQLRQANIFLAVCRWKQV